MNKINLIYIIGLFFFVIFFCNCDVESKQQENRGIVYYKEFDIFHLRGTDTLQRVNKNQSVEVRYGNQLPVYIKYYNSKGTITLIMEDSFSVNYKPVYVYTTSNFHGGPPGRHKLYTSHHVEYKDLIYVSFSDTLICETKDVPPTRNFGFDLYVKESLNKIIRVSKGEIDYDGENAKLTRQQLYLKWLDLLQEEYKKNTIDPIIIDKIPPG